MIRHLHDLVDAGIIDRHDAGTVPPCVHYSISEYGRTLTPVLQALCDWGRTHMEIRQRQKAQTRARAAAPTRPASPPSSAGTTRSPRRKSSPA
ncbi:helix-turn-helix domain-containing protein [Mycolicibacterium boenickei]